MSQILSVRPGVDAEAVIAHYVNLMTVMRSGRSPNAAQVDLARRLQRLTDRVSGGSLTAQTLALVVELCPDAEMAEPPPGA